MARGARLAARAAALPAALLLLLALLALLALARADEGACRDGAAAAGETCVDAADEYYEEDDDEDDEAEGDQGAAGRASRCERDPDAFPFLEAGEVKMLFEDLVAELEDDENDAVHVEVLSRDPWVVYVDNFLSDAEVDALLEEAGDDFQPSQELSSKKGASSRSQYRTSETKFCTGSCATSKAVKTVEERIAMLMGTDEEYMEFIQFVRYKKGQYYKSHHDSNPMYADMPMGHRVLTVFMYLNTIEDGGETRFPKLDLSVKPVRGRALIWANVLDSDPNERDLRTTHEALPVTGDVVKVAANFWLYQHDYRSFWPECTG